ncbi:RNA-binding protein [Oceanobacillus chungangensis]|uniref:RNA-binding protein n=1 Tax=Oceanobacillus chungangensis TaxID=1229152 RepID=A0A3D8PQE1_9BACI|nr:YlmH/Sll1252 family protein [Oceanobacillus chungangensis]RDW17912.1 RNA-binding protein [Oceanobacillus chungangensis]
MDIYQHFRKEEQGFIDQVLSWKEQVERTFVLKLTDFLDPREQQIIEMLIGTSNDELKLYQFGGAEQSERKRVVIAPYYEVITNNSFQLTLLQATYQDKFVTLEHRDVMGAFLSLGIIRKKLGDIYVKDGTIQIIMTDDIASYVITNLTSIKNATIRFEEKTSNSLLTNAADWVEAEKTVSSLRLDAVVKEIYRISRKDASDLITRQYVKVNHRVVEDAKFTVERGDLISVRGKGRSKLLTINGQSKKDKWRITTAMMK